MFGGLYFAESQFNRATQAKRQLGSTVKAIVFLAAMESGLSPASMIQDAPVTYWDPRTRKEWSPRNYTRRYLGRITLMQSMEDSINIAAVKHVDRLGIETVIETARRLGITSEIAPYLSIALGSLETTLMELVTAYATISSHGLRPTPHVITHVYNSAGNDLWLDPSVSVEATDPISAHLVIELLQGVTKHGTGRSARSLHRTVAGKTGTTDNYTDAWFVGFTPDLTAGVWVGYDMKRSLGRNETGGAVAQPIWNTFIARVLKDTPDRPFSLPEGLVNVKICRDTGDRASPSCRQTFSVNLPPERVPENYCRLHALRSK